MEITETDWKERFEKDMSTTKAINKGITKILHHEIPIYYKNLEKEETGNKISMRNCSEICQILYQCKEWETFTKFENSIQEQYFQFKDDYDVFLYTFGFKFIAAISDFHKELPWLNIKKLNNYILLLSDMGIIHRKKGIFKENPQLYAYKLNKEYGLIRYMFK